jgi:hypothetical protein
VIVVRRPPGPSVPTVGEVGAALAWLRSTTQAG